MKVGTDESDGKVNGSVKKGVLIVVLIIGLSFVRVNIGHIKGSTNGPDREGGVGK